MYIRPVNKQPPAAPNAGRLTQTGEKTKQKTQRLAKRISTSYSPVHWGQVELTSSQLSPSTCHTQKMSTQTSGPTLTTKGRNQKEMEFDLKPGKMRSQTQEIEKIKS